MCESKQYWQLNPWEMTSAEYGETVWVQQRVTSGEQSTRTRLMASTPLTVEHFLTRIHNWHTIYVLVTTNSCYQIQ